MKDIDELKKIAILIDAENAQASVIKNILNEISVHGHIIVKRAYGDWSKDSLKNWKDVLNLHAIQPEQQFSYTSGKNSSDARMIIDAMDLLYTGKFDAFVLVTSDSDFTSLATRLKQSEIYVFGVGENKTPLSFRNACDDFILTENLKESDSNSISSIMHQQDSPENKNIPKEEASNTKTGDKNNLSEIIELLKKGWEIYHDDDDYVNAAGVGQYIKRSKPDFDVRSYGFTKLPELISKLSQHFETKEYKGKGGVKIFAYKPKNQH